MSTRPPQIVDHALELFAPLGALRVKRMFGGWGFYADGLFFALVARDTLYLKADAQSKAGFIEAGCTAFIYEREGKPVALGYWSAPEAALDSPTAMAPWARMAIDCALRHRTPRRPPARRG
ncbi:TfoX/Sxy family protein [Nitrogeniibacter mangrovi]|uniref:TfoX/Sxy family protein n=1 Tax=Nitrogeniibacter mangrovi TaxID=2016596 RepID=A0A6C1B6G6_9RHOO|nr:TfoX/Sxy family protein [Nitrogeniibacter mangrovi]QID19326.1 TfoX/Sxy family protein [Nitrogeniibacter mangrovi]